MHVKEAKARGKKLPWKIIGNGAKSSHRDWSSICSYQFQMGKTQHSWQISLKDFTLLMGSNLTTGRNMLQSYLINLKKGNPRGSNYFQVT
jgi:hypothetical protein